MFRMCCLKPPLGRPSLVCSLKPLAKPFKCSYIITLTMLLLLLLSQAPILPSFGVNGNIPSRPDLLAFCLSLLERVSLLKLPVGLSISRPDHHLSSAFSFPSRLLCAQPAKGPAQPCTSQSTEPAAASGSPLLLGVSGPLTSLLRHAHFFPLAQLLLNAPRTTSEGLTALPFHAGSAPALSITELTGMPRQDQSATSLSHLSTFPSQPSDSLRPSLDRGTLPHFDLG